MYSTVAARMYNQNFDLANRHSRVTIFLANTRQIISHLSSLNSLFYITKVLEFVRPKLKVPSYHMLRRPPIRYPTKSLPLKRTTPASMTR